VLTRVLDGVTRRVALDAVARELLSLAGAAGNVPRALGQPAPEVSEVPVVVPWPARTRTTPVLLVHGYLGTEAVWAPLVPRLHRNGFVDVFTLRYDTLSAGVPQLAAGLVEAVRTVLRRTGSPDVHLVGHSLGGLVARYAVQLLGLDEVTRSVVTVGTPHRGTRLAWLGLGPAAAQLQPGSGLLRDLPPLEDTSRVRWAVVQGSADILVSPRRARDELSLSGYGHHSVLGAPELADVVVAHLAASDRPSVHGVPSPDPAGAVSA
jgi:triacylglycerol lipase